MGHHEVLLGVVWQGLSQGLHANTDATLEVPSASQLVGITKERLGPEGLILDTRGIRGSKQPLWSAILLAC
eukprot:2744794-Heterocapsa_arctica.AAC.1